MSAVATSREREQGAREGFTAVTPYIMTPDVDRLIDFAKRVFGAEEIGSWGGVHHELRIGDSILKVGGTPEGSGATPRLVGLHVYVDDADAVYQRALDAGATSLGAPEDRHYGERAGFVKDPAGNHWYVATHTGPSYMADPRTVTPYLYVQHAPGKGAAAFIDFLEAAFGARAEHRFEAPNGMIGHAVMRIGGAPLELGEGSEPQFDAPAAFYLRVTDCDALYEQALRAGGTSVCTPSDQPWGDRMGGIQDPWGNEWFIATHVSP